MSSLQPRDEKFFAGRVSDRGLGAGDLQSDDAGAIGGLFCPLILAADDIADKAFAVLGKLGMEGQSVEGFELEVSARSGIELCA